MRTWLLSNLKRALPYLVCVAAGWAAHEAFRDEPQAIMVETVVERIVEAKTQVVTAKDKTTKTTKPDGTVTETHEVTLQEAKQVVKAAEAAKQTVTIAPAARPAYSVELRYLPSLTVAPSVQDTAVDVGARLGNSNAWGTLGYDLKYKQVSFGIRYEF